MTQLQTFYETIRITSLKTASNSANRKNISIFRGKGTTFMLALSPLKLILTLTLTLTLFSPAGAEERKVLKPSPKDKCPVCGMFVAKYPDWVAAIRFREGSTVFFDGAKDMFKFYFDLKKYNPSKRQTDIETLQVTDYYDLTPVNGFEAFYVLGSDVYGPMGRELIPFAKEEAAKEFLTDHKGKSIIKFKEVTPALIKTLD
jgi:nitrous oxide reductase accessory protein NosL